VRLPDLRRAFGSLLIQAGASQPQGKQQMGNYRFRRDVFGERGRNRTY